MRTRNAIRGWVLRHRRRLVIAGAIFAVTFGPKTGSYLVHRQSSVAPEDPRVRSDLLNRGRYLAATVPEMTTEDMPSTIGEQFRGEWLVVSHSMTAMALTNLAFLYPEEKNWIADAVDRIVAAMLTPDARHFDAQRWGEDPLDSLDGPRGHIGYLGHLEIVLLAQQLLGRGDHNLALTRSIAVALHKRIRGSSTLHAETYPGETYVADNTVVIACLALAQRLFPDAALDLSADWTQRVRRDFLDPATGLMVFRLEALGLRCKAVAAGLVSKAGANRECM